MVLPININNKNNRERETYQRRSPLLLFIFCILIFITDTVVAQSPVPHKKQQALNLIKQKLPPTYAIISSELLYLDTMEYTLMWISNYKQELEKRSEERYLQSLAAIVGFANDYPPDEMHFLDSTLENRYERIYSNFGESLAYDDAITLLNEVLYQNGLMELVPFYYIRLTIRDGYGESREVVYFLDTTMTLVTNNSEYFFDAIKPE